MHTLLLLASVTLATAGCASTGFNRSGGAGGAEVMSGETATPASESGAAYDNIATSGSNPSDPASGPAR